MTRANLRACASTLMVTLKVKAVTPFTYLTWLVLPLLISAVGMFLLASRPGPQVVYGVLGGGLVGCWSMAHVEGGNAIQDERWQGTLEHLVGAPTPLGAVVLGKILASLLFGLASFLPTMTLAFLGFHARLRLDVVPFAVSFALVMLSFLALSVTLAPLFVLWRSALSFVNGAEIAVYALCGFMFPVALLPGWAQAFAAPLAPSWGVRALYAAAGGVAHPAYGAWWLTGFGVSAAWLLLAVLLFQMVAVRSRGSGQLSFA